MKSIDLVQFADHSQKLPSPLLMPAVAQQKKTFFPKFLGAHFLDFLLVVSVTSAFSQNLTESINLLLKVKLFASDLSMVHSASFTSLIFPLVLLCYFSFFYLMNHGQTLGMTLLKHRIEMKNGNLKDAFRWGCYSFSVCFSGGISYFLLQNFKIREAFKSHDYLYSQMMTPVEIKAIDLLSETSKYNTEVYEEEFKIAA